VVQRDRGVDLRANGKVVTTVEEAGLVGLNVDSGDVSFEVGQMPDKK
jgi:hypothetical protein